MIKIAFIGAGRMASAMIGGLLKNNHYRATEIGCTCGNDPTGPQLAEKTGITYEPDLGQLLKMTEIAVLACKPQQFNDLSPELASLLKDKLVVSILAGTTLEKLNAKFNQARNVVRAMPNTPGQIGAGITGYSPAQPLSSQDSDAVAKILGSLGEIIELPENKIDAVTAVSGSGPAYLFEFAAALREAAKAVDLDDATAEKLALHTIFGAAKLLEATGEDPETLRNNVTSPNGTTQAALESFQANNLRDIVQAAVTAARDRSIELAKI